MAVMPIWTEWLNRSHGNVSFHLTQLLTGHGVFYSFLKRIGKANSDKCPHCDLSLPNTMEHTLIQCTAWEEERRDLLNKTNLTLDVFTLQTIVKHS